VDEQTSEKPARCLCSVVSSFDQEEITKCSVVSEWV